MSSKDQPVTFWGAVIMFWLLVAISAVAAVPMAVGVVGVALVPGVGELRSYDPWLWLNLLWMFPAFWIITTVINAFLTALLVIGIFRRIDDVFEDLLIWFSVAWLFTTFFQSFLGALMASLVALILMKFLFDWLEKHPPRKNEKAAREVAEESGS